MKDCNNMMIDLIKGNIKMLKEHINRNNKQYVVEELKIIKITIEQWLRDLEEME